MNSKRRTLCLTLMVAVKETACGCVEEKTAELKAYLDPLVAHLSAQTGPDITDILCSGPQKSRLDHVIQLFQSCPGFSNSSVIEELKHNTSAFSALELFHVASADDFCECATKQMCMKQVDTNSLYKALERGPWTRIANIEYICGVGSVHIDCIAPSITKCAAYLEFKHKQNAFQLNLRITSLVHYIGQCGKWSVSKSLSCVKQRAGWKSTIFCHNQALNFAEDRDRTCGMRSCIEQAMSSCPDNQMTYFIDAVNVFSETRIDTDKCITYSTGDHITVTMTSMLTTSLLYLICILFQ